MTLTYDEIWHLMAQAKNLISITNDALLRSAIHTLARALSRCEGESVSLTTQEGYAANCVRACEDARFTLFGPA